MKISLVVDKAGRILGFAHPASDRTAPLLGSASGRKVSTTKAEVALADDDELSTQSIELPAELANHVGKDTFAEELFQHKLVKRAGVSTLTRAKNAKRK